MKPVVLSDPLPPLFDEIAGAEFDIRRISDEGQAIASDAQAIFSYGHFPIDGALMDRLPMLKVISNHGVGVDHIDLSAAASRGIPVGNTPGCLDAATADHTMALLLATARNVVVGDQFARSDEFSEYDPGVLLGTEVTGQTIGIIGMGRIGLEVARRAAAFEMPIQYSNRSERAGLDPELGARFVSVSELLRTSDFVVLNCPLTDQTAGMIGMNELKLMKSNAVLINMARGGVVNTEELCDALERGEILAAGLDVTEPEPLPRGHRLLSMKNVVLTPHLGSATIQTRRRMMTRAIENLQAGVAGRGLPFPVLG